MTHKEPPSLDLLILTATLRPPPGAPQLMRTDPAARMHDYQEALAFYLDLLARRQIAGLVFGDNSGSELGPLQAMARARGVAQRTEFISFYDLNYPAGHGRGYGEFRLLDALMARSALVACAPPAGAIWKVTGRYVVRNLVELMRTRPAKAELYCHCRNIPLRWVDLYALAWTKAGYQEILQGVYEDLKEDVYGRSAEVMMRERIDRRCRQRSIARRFPVVPRVEGIRGLDNRRYEDSRAKYLVRNVGNRMLPWLWL